jgi:26S proteasome regulatory subunit N2
MLTLLQPTGGVVVVLDKKPNEPRETIELRATTEIRQAAISDAMQYFADRIQAQDGANAAFETPQRGGAAADATGAALAAGVLTAVDEDEEGAEDAPVPDEFGYETDNMEE